MGRRVLRELLRAAGLEVHRVARTAAPAGHAPPPVPPPVQPVWPLPRRPGGPSDEAIRKAFAGFDRWHYAFQFEDGLSFSAHHTEPGPLADVPERPLQRFRHFMPYLLQACGGSLEGKRVLDIACNAGFWSIQCALLGAQVVAFDSRPELIDQARLVKSIVGVESVSFQVLDYWDMSLETLGGTFDVVLMLGILYHLPEPIEALRLACRMARTLVLVDSGVYRSCDSLVKLDWEEPFDIRAASEAGVVAVPSRSAFELILRHIGAVDWYQIPVRSADMPADYLDGRRASWLVRVQPQVRAGAGQAPARG